MSEGLKPCPFCKGLATDPRGGDVHCQNHECPGWNMRLCHRDKWNRRADLPPTLSAAMELPEVRAMRLALLNIGELNKAAADENGHKWDNSDLIAQEVFFALAPFTEAKP